MSETPGPSGLPDEEEPEPTPMGVDEEALPSDPDTDAMPGIQEGEPDAGG